MGNLISFFNFNPGRSKRIFDLGSIEVTINKQNSGIRLTTEQENWFIQNQTIDETETIIEKNFNIVKEYYREKAGTVITAEDLDNVCLKIVLYYFSNV